jgi:two-component system nitrate/nitrite response regulator NarL
MEFMQPEFANIRVFIIVSNNMLSLSLVNFLSGYFSVMASDENMKVTLQKIDDFRPHHIIFCPDTKLDKHQKILVDMLHAGYINTSVFTSGITPELQDHLVLHGIKGVLDAAMRPEHMVKAVRRLCDGEIWLDRKSMTRLIKMLPQVNQHLKASTDGHLLKTLTSREQEIAKICSNMLGASNKEIAKKLSLNESSLRNYLSSIYSTLKLRNRHEFFMFLMRNKDQF